MITPSEFTVAITAFKAAKDIAQGMLGLRDTEAFKAKLIEFQSKILDAQGAVFAANDERADLIHKIAELEKELAMIRAWEVEKQKYALKSLKETADSAIYVYTSKEGINDGEPEHYICVKCYQDGYKSILQSEIRNPGRSRVSVCHRCKSEIYTSGFWHPDHGKRK